MTAEAALAALGLPSACRIDRRIPKTLWPEPLRAALADAAEELRWLAVLKPETCAIAARPDAPEIQILSLDLRPDVKPSATERLHRAVPYPAVALVRRSQSLSISLREAACGLAGDPVTAAWLPSLALALQNRDSLATVYAGWTAQVRRLAEPVRIESEIARLRAQAKKEKRTAALAETNLRLQQLQSELAATREALCR